MLRPILLVTLACGGAFAATKTPLTAFSFGPAPAPAATNAPAYSTPSVFHCQVPCGIYGDHMRIEMMLEDATTIEKGMTQVLAMERGENTSSNQIVRWVMNKETHAQAIQDQVAQYWLAQRIKAPKEGASKDDVAKYARQLRILHGITVAAMKCKQTTDVEHVAVLRLFASEFAASYFSAEDMEHLRSHMGGEGHDAAAPADKDDSHGDHSHAADGDGGH
jgi:nickel superoxide dismutase